MRTELGYEEYNGRQRLKVLFVDAENAAHGDRIGDEMTLRQRIAIWNADRNTRSKKIDWQFQTKDARIKRRRLYPKIKEE